MNTKHSHTFRKHGKRCLQLSFLSTLIAQSLVYATAQASSGELPADVDVSTAVGLVAAYSFDDGNGTTVTDLSGNGNTGTISGASWTSQGKFSNALTFDGISNWVTVNDSDSLELSGGMTLEAWAYPTAAPGTWTTILLKEAPPGYNLAYHLQGDSLNHPSSYITTRRGRTPGYCRTKPPSPEYLDLPRCDLQWRHILVAIAIIRNTSGRDKTYSLGRQLSAPQLNTA